MNDLVKIGERLTDAMFYAGDISTAKLAELTGVTVQTVSRWKRGEKPMLLSNLIKVADILNCILDYLIGRDENTLNFNPRSCPPFYERLRKLMEDRGVSWYKLTKETSIKDSCLYLWKKGADTKIPSLITLADYFDCSADYLVGRER